MPTKNFLLIKFNRQTLQPHIEFVYKISVLENERLEDVLKRDFDYDGFMKNHGIIDLENLDFGNTADCRFNTIQMHTLSYLPYYNIDD